MKDQLQLRQLGQRIRKRRLELGLSLSELATSVGKTSPAYISNIESGERNITTVDLIKLAKQLHVNVSDLIDENATIRTPKFSEALRADEELSKKDKQQIEEYYNLIKNKKKYGG